MLASDWESLEAAAARVHILNYSQKQGDAYQLEPSIFPSLACAAPGRTGLLPLLQKLTWTTTNNVIYPYIFLFLSPTIKDLTISMATGHIASDRMRFSLLASLTSQCPSVCSLRLDAGKLQDPVPSWGDLFSGNSASAFTSLSLWRALGSLSLQNMDICALIDVLVTLPALTNLELHWCQISASPNGRVTTGFPALQYLGTYHCNMDITLYVLKRMSCTPLVRLCLSIAARPSETRWAELFSYLQNGILHDRLAAVSFSIDHDPPMSMFPRYSDRITWTFQTISPLLHFRHISEFKHSRLCILDLDDNDIASIARAWPRLKLFILHSAHTIRPRLTHHALLPFSRHCPELEILAMVIDTTRVGKCGEKLGRGSWGRSLRELIVYNSPIYHSSRVAAFISDIFPNVRAISSDNGYREWNAVQMIIPVLTEVRRQEANHWCRSNS